MTPVTRRRLRSMLRWFSKHEQVKISLSYRTIKTSLIGKIKSWTVYFAEDELFFEIILDSSKIFIDCGLEDSIFEGLGEISYSDLEGRVCSFKLEKIAND